MRRWAGMASASMLALLALGCSRAPGEQPPVTQPAPVAQPPVAQPPVAQPAPVAQPPDAQPPDAQPPDAQLEPPNCGRARCAADAFCEERRKGHALDEQGRPLNRLACVPLPAPCRAQPTCACVTAHVHATRCRQVGGLIHTDDYPR